MPLKIREAASLTILAASAAACGSFFPDPVPDDQILDGPVSGLTEAENQRFLNGDAAFSEVFTTANGLGPLFVATSCFSCHPGDGKGHPFTTLTRFGQSDPSGNLFLGEGGPQLQHRAIPGFVPESIPPGAPSARLVPPANTGLGHLEAVADQDIIDLADPFDADGDGISGVPSWIELPPFVQPSEGAVTLNGRYLGRFGKKASAYNLLHQTVNAYIQDIGVTTDYHPSELPNASDNVPDPETPGSTVDEVVFYLRTLKTPVRRDTESAEVEEGEALFAQAGCAKCHVKSLTTASSPIAPLANKTFYPYTDMLLHDMGSGLDDGYTEGSALSAEWRTPPLWGLGLSKQSQGGTYFLLHDGRAKSIEEAILLHGGEGQSSRDAFGQFTDEQVKKLIRFLESL